MRFTFNSLMLAPVLLVALALTSTTAARADSTLNVPFGFKADGKSWPAGTYILSKGSLTNFVTLRSSESTKSMVLVLRPGNAKPSDTGANMKFDDIDGTRVLRSVQYGSLETPCLDHAKSHSQPSTIVRSSGQ